MVGAVGEAHAGGGAGHEEEELGQHVDVVIEQCCLVRECEKLKGFCEKKG